MSEDSPPPVAELELFQLRAGMIESEGGQSAVDNFAADFQALRHFGGKIGEAFDLGEPWQGALREVDYTVMYTYPGGGKSAEDPGMGGVIGSHALLFEMIETLSNQES